MHAHLFCQISTSFQQCGGPEAQMQCVPSSNLWHSVFFRTICLFNCGRFHVNLSSGPELGITVWEIRLVYAPYFTWMKQDKAFPPDLGYNLGQFTPSNSCATNFPLPAEKVQTCLIVGLSVLSQPTQIDS